MRRHVRAGRSSRCNAIVGVTYFSLQREKPVIGGLALRSLTFHQRPQEISNPVGRQGPAWSAVIDARDKLASLGLRFTREILVYAIRALPKMIVSILMLIAFCGGLAFALVEVFDIDPLTAYLATSPGGADSVAIIAASTNVDVGFVMAQQIARFMLVLIVGPALSRFVADQIARIVPNISDKTPT